MNYCVQRAKFWEGLFFWRVFFDLNVYTKRVRIMLGCVT